MKLSPVDDPPPPPWPENDEYKPALGCWMWNPTFGEVRLETNAKLCLEVIANVWEESRFKPQAAEKLQPVICFADRASKLVKQVGKTFYTPIIKIVGWVERDRVPGWAARTPTVSSPAAPGFLEAARAEKSDITLQALCDRLSAERGVKADTSMMSRFFRKIGVTVKKRPSSRVNRIART